LVQGSDVRGKGKQPRQSTFLHIHIIQYSTAPCNVLHSPNFMVLPITMTRTSYRPITLFVPKESTTYTMLEYKYVKVDEAERLKYTCSKTGNSLISPLFDYSKQE
jgi:hypothetical protein